MVAHPNCKWVSNPGSRFLGWATKQTGNIWSGEVMINYVVTSLFLPTEWCFDFSYFQVSELIFNIIQPESDISFLEDFELMSMRILPYGYWT